MVLLIVNDAELAGSDSVDGLFGMNDVALAVARFIVIAARFVVIAARFIVIAARFIVIAARFIVIAVSYRLYHSAMILGCVAYFESNVRAIGRCCQQVQVVNEEILLIGCLRIVAVAYV